jgi:tetratricopeptide (TPR) repeat protein
MVIYPMSTPPPLESILGLDFDIDVNRERAIERSQKAIEKDPENAYAWFNLGTNLLYFERYREATDAFDNALFLGLPWRFTRYQFGPYIAYFHSGRTEDLINLAEATLHRTAKAEESLLWRGWGRYRQGDTNGAVEDFLAALEINPNYLDAQYALDYIGWGL